MRALGDLSGELCQGKARQDHSGATPNPVVVGIEIQLLTKSGEMELESVESVF